MPLHKKTKKHEIIKEKEKSKSKREKKMTSNWPQFGLRLVSNYGTLIS